MATAARNDKPYPCPCGITLSRRRDLTRHERTEGHINFLKTGELNIPKESLINDKEGTLHAHYWAIETANGPLSPGVCKRCGKVQRFTNSLMGQGDWFRSGEEDEQNADERASTFT